MRFLKFFILLSILGFLLASCQSTPNNVTPLATSPVEAVSTPVDASNLDTYPEPIAPSGQPDSTAYPGPYGDVSVTPFNPYPAPGETASIPPSGFEPAPGDESLERGQVFLEQADSQLLSLESFPMQVSLLLRGNLPTACHKLRIVVTPANASNQIQIEAYSVVDPNVMCTQALEPFEASIPLGSYAQGKYSVIVNGALFGEFGN